MFPFRVVMTVSALLETKTRLEINFARFLKSEQNALKCFETQVLQVLTENVNRESAMYIDF